MNIVSYFVVICVGVTMSQVSVTRRCDLAMDLVYNHNIQLDEVADWICLVEEGSSYNTTQQGDMIEDGVQDHGVFQISDRRWCNNWDGGCNMPCSDFRDSFLNDDILCAQKMFSEQFKVSGIGFAAWPVWRSHCQGQNVTKYVAGCFDMNPESDFDGGNLTDSNFDGDIRLENEFDGGLRVGDEFDGDFRVGNEFDGDIRVGNEFDGNIRVGNEFDGNIRVGNEFDGDIRYGNNFNGNSRYTPRNKDRFPSSVEFSPSVEFTPFVLPPAFPPSRSPADLLPESINEVEDENTIRNILHKNYKPQPGFSYRPLDSKLNNPQNRETTRTFVSRRKTNSIIPTAIRTFKCQSRNMKCEWTPENQDFPYRCKMMDKDYELF